jgi:branched-chain amino acid transport system substrate-binding protein
MRIESPTYPPLGRLARAAASLAAAAAMTSLASGCGAGGGDTAKSASGSLTIYSSLPREGLSARTADAVGAGERLALSDAHGRAAGRRVRLVELNSAVPGGEIWDPAAVEANARRAAGDPSAIAYLGELDLGGSAVSIPVTNADDLLQVSPGDGLTTLTRLDPAQPDQDPARYYPTKRRNFVRLVPPDSVEARALVDWVREGGARSIAIVRDDRLSGRELATEAAGAARGAGLAVTIVDEARHGTATYADLATDLAGKPAEAVLYTGEGGRDGDRILAAAAQVLPAAKLYGTSALAESPPTAAAPARGVDVLRPAAAPAGYGAAGRRVLGRLRAERGMPAAPEALYGYEAMRLVLDAIARAGADPGDRRAVTSAALAPRARSSPIGPFRVTPTGDVTGIAFAAYRRDRRGLTYLGHR